jgi:hypothetical protein
VKTGTREMPAEMRGKSRWIRKAAVTSLTRLADERAAFLAGACAGDEELRREIESLVAQSASADAVLTGGAAVAAARLVSDAGRRVLTGRRARRLSNPGAARRRRYGRGVPRPRHAACGATWRLKSCRAPVHPDRASAENEWTPILAPTGAGRTAGLSPDGSLLYALLETDGFRCLYGLRLDPQTGQPRGSPFLIAHFHDAARSLNPSVVGNLSWTYRRTTSVPAGGGKPAELALNGLRPQQQHSHVFGIGWTGTALLTTSTRSSCAGVAQWNDPPGIGQQQRYGGR